MKTHWMGADAVEAGPADPAPVIGRMIRQTRRERRLTVEQLAEQAGVSSGLVSQLERGLGNPSMRNLQKLAYALGLRLGSLFREESPPAEPGPAAGALPLRPSRRCAVVRAGARKKLVLPHERIVYELLTPDLNRRLEVIRSVVPVDFDNSDVPFQHEGEECVHVLRGQVEVHVGELAFVLDAGDTITYDAGIPHWWRNTGGQEAESIAALTPPSF